MIMTRAGRMRLRQTIKNNRKRNNGSIENDEDDLSSEVVPEST